MPEIIGAGKRITWVGVKRQPPTHKMSRVEHERLVTLIAQADGPACSICEAEIDAAVLTSRRFVTTDPKTARLIHVSCQQKRKDGDERRLVVVHCAICGKSAYRKAKLARVVFVHRACMGARVLHNVVSADVDQARLIGVSPGDPPEAPHPDGGGPTSPSLGGPTIAQ